MTKSADTFAHSVRDAALYRLWARVLNKPDATKQNSVDWNEENFYLSGSGIGMEEALGFLFNKQPDFPAFLQWIQETYKGGVQEQYTQQDDVLTAGDMRSWHENGYVVLKNAVTPEKCTAARNAIWHYLGASSHDPDSWYAPHDGKNGMMLKFFQHPALDTNRHSPRIRRAYEQLYGDTDIYLLVDKVSFNVPETANHKFIGSSLHWDVSLHLPIPFVLQGLLYLNDVSAEDGAFHCVPGFHRSIGEWMAALPDGADPREQARIDLKPVAVPGNAGDLVIWHQALPHCATPNKGALPRMVQYIAYKPVIANEAEVWK